MIHRHENQTRQSGQLPVIPELSPASVSTYVPIAETNTHPNITHALLRALPSQKDIEILLGSVTEVSMLCCQSSYKSRGPNEMPKEEVATPNLLYPEAHPILLARQMLLFAVALQSLSPTEPVPGLTRHHHVIMEELAESAIKMVNADDGLLGTLEGLENIIVEGHYHIDCGNIRRAWITMRRAVMAAQLLGLHRPGSYRFKIIDERGGLDPEAMWSSIVFIERMLSLLLGLPTSTGVTSSATQGATSYSSQGCGLPTVLMSTIAKILERNQIHVSQQALDVTGEIDRELVKAMEQLPSAFWRPPDFAGLEANSVAAFLEIRRTADHMCYYTVVNQLHLPYMLWPSHSPQSIYSRIACVSASREILSREIAMRTFNPITPGSRMGDFMALIAGMTLMLAHIVSHCQSEMENLLLHQRSSDRAIVERALECMKTMSELRDDVLAAKCGILLKNLLAVEANAAQAQRHDTRELQETDGDHGDDETVLIINVPYLGAIRIARRGTITMTPTGRLGQERDLHEDVTIGGIGSLRVNGPHLPVPSNVDGPSDVAAPRTATARAIPAPSTQHAMVAGQVGSGDTVAQQDQMFPDAAASMDSWTFQGFDTAFFDVLMRESRNQHLNDISAADWNI